MNLVFLLSWAWSGILQMLFLIIGSIIALCLVMIVIMVFSVRNTKKNPEGFCKKK